MRERMTKATGVLAMKFVLAFFAVALTLTSCVVLVGGAALTMLDGQSRPLPLGEISFSASEKFLLGLLAVLSVIFIILFLIYRRRERRKQP